MANFWNTLFGRGGGFEKTPNMSPEAMDWQKQVFGGQQGIGANPLYGQGMDFLSQLLSNEPGAFEQFAAPQLAQFNQQAVPGLASRFAGQGTGAGALNSSSFQNALAQAGSGLQRDLGAMRAQMQMNALPQALQYAGAPEQQKLSLAGMNPYSYNYRQPTTGFLPQALGNIGGAFGSGLGFRYGYGGQ
jgi:hypothetical protein